METNMSQPDLAQALDVAAANVFVVDADLQIEFCNRQAIDACNQLGQVLASVGLSAQQMVGTPLERVVGSAANQLMTIGRRTWECVAEIGGEALQFRGNAMQGDDGSFAGAVLAWEVVTSSLSDDVEASERAKLLAAVNSQQAVIEFNLDGTVITANDNFCSTLGYSLPEIVGQHHRTFVTTEYSQSAEYREFWAKLNRGEPESGDFLRMAKGAREVWINATYFPITDDAGKPVKVVKFATDITAQREVASSAQRSADAMNAVATNILVCDEEYNIIYGNEKSIATLRSLDGILVDAFGVRADQVVGGSIDRFHKNASHQRGLLQTLRGRNHTAEFGLGDQVLSLSASGLFNSDGEFSGAVVNWEVVTEQKRMENAIKENAAAEAAAAAELSNKVDSLLSVVEEFSKGDLTIENTVSGDDPVGQLGSGLTRMIVDLRSIIVQIKEGAEQFSASAGTISNASSSLSEASQTNAATVEEMTASVDQLTESIRMIAQNAADANSIADETSHKASAGGDAVDRSITAMKEINRSSEQISEIIQVISEIASQTNLLALNAAIEAARAGEHGLGFAVVADEVRKLAERSSEAAKQITGLIRESTQRVVEGTKLSEDTGQALKQIIEGVTSTAESISQIASATDEQSATAEEVGRAIQNVAKLTENNSGNATDMAASAEELSAQAVAMKELVRRFKI
jgi:methyl-accepting chemotaxis protein